MSRVIHERVTEPLREEHRHLFPHVDQLAAGTGLLRSGSRALLIGGASPATGWLIGASGLELI